jgi:hypothetical protein
MLEALPDSGLVVGDNDLHAAKIQKKIEMRTIF